MIPPTIRLNGKVYTRNSVSIRPNGAARITGVDSVQWSDEMPSELIGAMNDGGVPVGKGTGPYKCSASISVYLDEAPAFETIVLLGSPLAGQNLNAATFQLPIIVREDVRLRTVVLVNCNIVGRSVSVGADGSALVQEYTLQPTLVLEDGKSLVNLIPAL